MSLSRASLSPWAMRVKQSCSSSRVRARGKDPVLLASRRVKKSPLSINKSHAVHMVTTSMWKCMHGRRVPMAGDCEETVGDRSFEHPF